MLFICYVVDILGSLDESIEILEKKIETLLQIYALEYKLLIANKATNAQLSDIALVETGKRPPVKESIQSVNFSIPIIGASSVMGYTNGVLYSEPILVIGRVGTHGVVQPLFKECWASDNTLVIKSEYYSYVYNVLSNIDYASINKGSTQPLITQTDIRNTPIYLPAKDELRFFEKKCSMTVISVYQTQIDKLKEAKQLYLKKFFG